jgi:hypothetical protein
MHIGPIVRVLAAWLTIVARSGFDWAAAGIGAGVILSSSPRRLAAQLPLARELAAVRSLSAIRR